MRRSTESKKKAGAPSIIWRLLLPLNFILTFFLAIACVLFFLIKFSIEIPLPNSARTYILDKVAEYGISADFDKAFFNLRGDIAVTNLKLRIAGTPKDILKADSASVSLSIRALLDELFPITKIDVFCATLSPTCGNSEGDPNIERLNLRVSVKGQLWIIDFLEFKLDGLSVSVSGAFDENFSFEKFMSDTGLSKNIGVFSKKTEESQLKNYSIGDVADTVDSAFAKFYAYEKNLDSFSSPSLEVSFNFLGAYNSLDATFDAGSARFYISEKEKLNAESHNLDESDKHTQNTVNNKQEIDSSEIIIKSPRVFLNIKASEKTYSAKCGGRAEQISYGEEYSAKGISLCGDVVPKEAGFAFGNFEALCREFSYNGSKIRNIYLRNDWLDFDNYREGWIVCAGEPGRMLACQIDFDESFRASIFIEGSIEPDRVVEGGAFDEFDIMRDFSFPNGIFLDAKASFDFKSMDFSIDGSFDIGKAVIYRMPVDGARGDFAYDTNSNVLNATNIYVKSSEGWKIKGGFKQQFDDMRYFITIDGDIRPMAISHFMAPWWSKVFNHVKFCGTKNFGNADAVVEGIWGEPDYIWAFVGVSGKNAEYNQSHFDSFSLKVWVNPTRITLYDVRLRENKRTAHAVLEWLYGSDGLTTYERQLIRFESVLNVRELVSLGGEDAQSVLDVIKFTTPPRLSLDAVLYNPSNNPAGRRDVFNADIFAGGKTNIEDFATVENIRCRAVSDSIVTRITDASFGFCGGHGTGGVNIEKTPEGRIRFDGDMNFASMNQKDFIEFLSSLGSEKGGKKSDGIKIDMENGVVNGVAKLSGFTDDGKSLKGDGYLSLENAELMKLNLFGALSRALSALKLPIGSFDLTYLNSPFEIDGGNVRFSKLEIGGDVMKIHGGATYNFIDDDLNAAFFISPFGGISTGLIGSVISAINPITNIIEVSLTGELDNPKISIKMNPVNMLQSDKSIIRDIRESL